MKLVPKLIISALLISVCLPALANNNDIPTKSYLDCYENSNIINSIYQINHDIAVPDTVICQKEDAVYNCFALKNPTASAPSIVKEDNGLYLVCSTLTSHSI